MRLECLKLLVADLKNEKIDAVVEAESRGVFFGMLTAQELNAGFVLIRSPNK
ncbi:adenine/guanine phosphoribosyltransferase-like PRPP-binding protein [Flavobacterium sp. 14A]|nr:adenine/guanine phosphoribosyltransferase-like PRPP-binding protein [Flavobacterium sp. 14A]